MSDLDLLVEMFAKVGQPVVEKKASKPAPVDYQPIVMDINWLNDYDEATAPQARVRLRKAAKTVAGQDIRNLKSVIEALNGLLKQEGLTQKEKQNHVETVAKLEIIRTLHNLLGSEIKGGASGVKGYLFEVFMQEVFGGKVETDTEANIVDINFENVATPVSLKFVKKDSDIGGSSALLKKQFEDDPTLQEVEYIVGEKDFGAKRVEFYRFPISREFAEQLPDPKTARRFKIKKPEAMKQSGAAIIGALDFSRAEEVTRNIFQDLDDRFKRLFSELQQLNAAAEVLRTDVATQDGGRGSAQASAKGKVTRKAGDVRKASKDA